MSSAFSLFSKEGSDIVNSFIDLVDSNNQFTVSIAENDNAKTPKISCPSDDSLYCTSCKVALQDRQEQVIHYRLDWHKINLKRKVQGKSPLSAKAFEEITSGFEFLAHNYNYFSIGDVSSISGSDSETSDEELSSSLQQRCSLFITFITDPSHHIYMIHRTVLFNAKVRVYIRTIFVEISCLHLFLLPVFSTIVWLI